MWACVRSRGGYLRGGHRVKTPRELDTMVDVVLAYKPKPRAKRKKRKKAKRAKGS